MVMWRLCTFTLLIGVGCLGMGCRSYRYTGFDVTSASYPPDVRLVVTNPVLKVEPSLGFWHMSMSESRPYESHSVLQVAKAYGEDALMKLVNERLAERAYVTAKNIPISVVVDAPEVEISRSFWGYLLTLSLIFPAEQSADERSKVWLHSIGKSSTGSIHVRGEGRGTVYSPWGLIAPESPRDAAYTETTSGISWANILCPFPPRVPWMTPSNDVLACDLADVLLMIYHGNNEEGIVNQ